MAEPALDPQSSAPRTWPLAPGEHPDLPRLHCELHPGRSAAGTARKPIPPRPPTARFLITTTRVIETANPDRIRTYAQELLDLADGLEQAHHDHTTGQLDLDGTP